MEITEIEARLEKGLCYKALLDQDFFGEDDSEAIQEVMEEIRQFVRSQLSVLLGVGTEPPKKLEFTPEQANVLRAVANGIIKKSKSTQETVQNIPPPQKETIKKVSPPEPVVNVKNAGVTVKPVKTTSKKKSKVEPKKQTPIPPLKIAKPVKPKSTEELETLSVDGIVYTKKETHPALGDIYINEEGSKYTIGVNEAGQKYMKRLSIQASPVGVKAHPTFTGSALTAVSEQRAAQEIAEIEKGRVHKAGSSISQYLQNDI